MKTLTISVLLFVVAASCGAEWNVTREVDAMTDAETTILYTTAPTGDRLVLACGGEKGTTLRMWISAESFVPSVSLRRAGGGVVGLEIKGTMRVDDGDPQKIGFDHSEAIVTMVSFPRSKLCGKVTGWMKKLVGHQRALFRVDAVGGKADVEFSLDGLAVSELEACYRP